MLTNSNDRPFAPGDLQRSVEKYTGNYADSTFGPAEPYIKLYLTVIDDLCEHKGSIATYCKIEPLCTVKVDRCADSLGRFLEGL